MGAIKLKKLPLLIAAVTLSAQGYSAQLGDVQVHGFISQGYVVSDEYDYFGLTDLEDGTFQYNEYGVNFISNLPNNVRVGMQLLGRDFGDEGNGDLQIDWAQGEYRYRDWLGLRIGKVKKAMGLYNQLRDIDVARTSVLLPTSIYPESLRSQQLSIVGGSIFGVIPGGFEYQAQFGTLDPDVANKVADEIQLGNSATLSLSWNTPVDGLRVVGSVSQYDFEFVEDETVRTYFEPTIGVDYSDGIITLAAEYRQSQVETDPESPRDATGDGFYIMGSYRLTEKLEVGSYYSAAYRNIENRDGEGTRVPESFYLKDLAVSARYDVTDFWVVKAEAHYMTGLQTVSSGDYDTSDPDFDENGTVFAFKSTFSF